MKVGIVTITELDNFGNRLQNFALQQVLKSIGCEVETIPNYITYKYRKSRKYQMREFLHAVKVSNREMISKLVKQWRFEKFDKKHFEFSKYYSTIDFISPQLNEHFDFFVAGSDQIWNPYFPFNREFNFLTFADKEKRVAYSASFGVEEIPEDKIEMYKAYLNGMKSISVREFAGQKIVEKLIGRNVPVLPDPTLLLTESEWCAIAKKPNWLMANQKYILTYFLGSTEDRNNLFDELYARYPEYEKLKIIDINEIQNIRAYSINPSEFIYLIQHAKLMVTDSFHGTVFSVIMKTPYITAKRKGGVSMHSRIESLHQLLEITPSEFICESHLTNTVHIESLKNKREKAILYLKEALV